MVRKFGVLLALAVFGVCAAVPLGNEIGDSKTEEHVPLKSLTRCAESGGVTGIVNCAAIRVLKSLQLAASKPELEVIPGVYLESDDTNNIQRVGKSLNTADLPADPQEKADKLYTLVLENASRVLSGRTLKLKMPENVLESFNSALEEGRARKRKKGMFPSFMMGLGAKMFTVVPAIIAGLGLLTAKALIVAKLALVISAVVFFQFFAGKGSSILGGLGGYGHSISTNYGTGLGGSYGTPQWTTNTVGGNGQYPYARSIDVAATSSSAQDLAYAKTKQI